MRQCVIVTWLLLVPLVFAKPVPHQTSRSFTIKVKPSQTLLTLFKRHRILLKDYYQMTQAMSATDKKAIQSLYPNQLIYVDVDQARRVNKMIIYQKNGGLLEVTRQGRQGFSFSQSMAKPHRYVAVSFTVKSSLYVDGLAHGLKVSHIREAMTIISKYSNMSVRSLRAGTVIRLYIEGYDKKKALSGRVVGMDVAYRDKLWQVTKYWLGDRQDFYTPMGLKNLSFLRFPIDKFRVSSSFSLSRVHPVLKQRRPHYGVDLATSHGAPVKCSAEGIVDFVGAKGGYGRTVVMDHGSGYKTIYAHLSGYKKALKRGDKIAQGEVIGYVGSSGVATGPHLHYEIRKHGVPQNPMKFEVNTTQKMMGDTYPLFRKFHDFIRQTRLLSSLTAAGEH